MKFREGDAALELQPRGLLPQLVSLLLLRDSPAWRPFAVDDFVAVIVLQFGMGYEGLDATAMGTVRGFRERLGLKSGGERADWELRVRSYFDTSPLPSSLVLEARRVVRFLREQRLPPALPGLERSATPWLAIALQSAA